MIDDIRAARDAALAQIDTADSLESVDRPRHLSCSARRARWPSSRQGSVRSPPSTRRRPPARRSTRRSKRSTAALEERTHRARRRTRSTAQIEAERLDLTEFVGRPTRGHAHLVTQAWERLEDVFIGLGFQVAEGPEVETDWHNFEALNMGAGHPARGEFDTLFVDHVRPAGSPAAPCCARTPRRCRSARCSTQEPPIYIVAPGRVFRRDTPDATHMPVFHQIEGLVVDRDITMADLAGTIEAFTKAFFGGELHRRGCGRATSRSPSRRPSSTSSGPTARGSSSAAAAWCTPTCCAPAASTPRSGAGSRSASASTAWRVMRHAVADIRDMFTNDIRFIEQF